MILAFHLILTAYGFWLPNDPRGSWSDFVGAWELLKFGPATTVRTRRSLAGRDHDRALRAAAKKALKYPCVEFTGVQARAIGKGFAVAVNEAGYVVHACSILPAHVHLVVAWHARHVRKIESHFKAKASMQLRAEGLHPLADYPEDDGSLPTPWTAKGWSVYLFTPIQVQRAIRYVEDNPPKEGKRKQQWRFVVPYLG